MDNKNPTGLKGMFQSMIPEAPGVIEGIVTNANPLQVTLANDSKMILGKNSLIVPRHLTDYMVEVDLQKSAGTLDSKTTADGGEHEHDGGGHGGHESGDGEHTHEGGKHVHSLSTFYLSSGMLHVYNSLKKGDTVYLLRFNGGKKYYILDRKG